MTRTINPPWYPAAFRVALVLPASCSTHVHAQVGRQVNRYLAVNRVTEVRSLKSFM